MDYRILFVYNDASSRQQYAATQTEVENIIVQELRSTVLNFTTYNVSRSVISIHVANLDY